MRGLSHFLTLVTGRRANKQLPPPDSEDILSDCDTPLGQLRECGMPLRIKAIGRSDRGLVRKGNEDFLLLDDANHLYLVCDGMGGHQAGEVASMTAADTIGRALSRFSAEIRRDAALKLERTLPDRGDLLVKAIRLANRAIQAKAKENSDLTGMGTTVVAAVIEADIMSIAHVGDSRIYRLNERTLEPLTTDHSWITEVQNTQNISREEASSFIGKNIITRALGVRPTVDIDYRVVKLRAGEVYILCTDGLCGFADDEEIFRVASECRADLNALVDNLIKMANDRGGSDNVTVVALQILEVMPSPLPELEPITLPSEPHSLLEIEDLWIQKFAQAVDTEPELERQTTPGKPNRLMLISLFVAFAIIAVLIVYFARPQ
jgi:serine/threonine protein phosphatase PrpC